MKFGSGHKAISVFVVLLINVIFLALFLDSTPNDKYHIFVCMSVFLTDALCFAILFFTIYKGIRTVEQDGVTIRAIWNFLYPFNNYYVAQFVCITCKVVFEVLIAVHLAFSISIPYVFFFIPFWLFFGIIFLELTRRLYLIQKKPLTNHHHRH